MKSTIIKIFVHLKNYFKISPFILEEFIYF